MMKEHIYNNIPLSFLSYFFFFLLLTTLPKSNSQQHETTRRKYLNCSRPFNCGLVSNIAFPFWDGVERPRYCGGRNEFKLNNCSDLNQPPFVNITSQEFQVLSINIMDYTMIMKMVREEAEYETCDPPLSNNTLPPILFQYTPKVYNITVFYDCPDDASFTNNFTCSSYYRNEHAFYVVEEGTELNKFSELDQRCGNRSLLQALGSSPLQPGADIHGLIVAVENGFEVKYDIIEEDVENCKRCRGSNGVCGRTEADEYQFSCHCPDGSQDSSRCQINKSNQWNWKGKLAIGATGATIAGLLICITIFYVACKPSTWQRDLWLTTKNNQHIEAFLKSHGNLTPKRYKFLDIKKMTNSFKVKLGQGGFGSIYKGKLPNGCSVAVKILNTSKGNGEDFMNEVASISRTSHVNVVTLLGFCLEGRKKALIYEFMSNGSLDKFIYQKGPETTNPSLSWDSMYQISLGIARGLEYLHRGCNTRILHFDIKPHNILLDENLCPKISDFGLAKLCPRKESIISMSDARGTLGYVAPEVWNRHFGGVSHKSDVYSYGMMLLEMVGGRKNINAEASNSSEIYYPHWLYKRLELNSDDLGADGVVTTEDNEIAKKLAVMGLWCIQTIPNDIPTIRKVIDMLEGSMDSLEVPPKPMFSSPTRLVPECSTTLSSIA